MTKYKVQMRGAMGWFDLKQRTVVYETVVYGTRKDAEEAARGLNPGEFAQGRLRVVPKELAEDCDVYPVVEREGGGATNK